MLTDCLHSRGGEGAEPCAAEAVEPADPASIPGLSQGMRKARTGYKKKLKRGCKHRGFRDPHGDRTGAPPVSHRDHTVGTPGVRGRKKAEGRTQNAESGKQAPPRKCCKSSWLRVPEGYTSGTLPGPSGDREPPIRALLPLREASSGVEAAPVVGKQGPIPKTALFLLYRLVRLMRPTRRSCSLRCCAWNYPRTGLICQAHSPFR